MVPNDQTAVNEFPLFLSFLANCDGISLLNKHSWDSNVFSPESKIELQKMKNTCLGFMIPAQKLHWHSVMAYLKYLLKIEFPFFPYTTMWLGNMESDKIESRRIRLGYCHFGAIQIL